MNKVWTIQNLVTIKQRSDHSRMFENQDKDHINLLHTEMWWLKEEEFSLGYWS